MHKENELKSPKNKTHGISEARTAVGTTAGRNENTKES